MYFYTHTCVCTFTHTSVCTFTHTHVCVLLYTHVVFTPRVCVLLAYWIHKDTHICVLLHTHVVSTPQTEEIVLQIITTAKISYNFPLESPYISNSFSRESPNFHTSFHVWKRSPRHSKDLSGKLIDLEVQIFV